MLTTSLIQKIKTAYKNIKVHSQSNVWIHLLPEPKALEIAEKITKKLAAGENLPLAGIIIGVKDCIDVASMPTTAGCPEFSYVAATDAFVVQKLKAAGAIIIGKTNLDQFATGLVGTRSPYGIVPAAGNNLKIAGGSSSGSAVAVALDMVDATLGTDTAGSGRVPAAFNNIVGIKTTLGLISTRGMVPACINYDTVTVFAKSIELCSQITNHIIEYDSANPLSRTFPIDKKINLPSEITVGIPETKHLDKLSETYQEAYKKSVTRLTQLGWKIKTIDIEPLLNAALLLYDGAIVAERYTAVGEFLKTNPPGADPIVKNIILSAENQPAWKYILDTNSLNNTKIWVKELFTQINALFLPTTTEHPTIAEIINNPVTINKRLGTFTNFCNLLDCAGVAVPGVSSTLTNPFGVMFIVPAFHDQIAIDLSTKFLQSPSD